jgi:hypothetical protein
MSDTTGLQFDRAEFQEGTADMTCAFCQQPILGSYFQINEATGCEACRYKIEAAAADPGSGIGRFARAAGAGLATAIGGAVLYYAISALTGYEFGLIAIVVGVAVGRAVRWGSKGRGGWRYQALAMSLTYFAIVATYIPPIIKAIREQPAETAATSTTGAASPAASSAPAAPAPAAEGADRPLSFGGVLLAFTLLLAFACAAPFLGGVQNIMGIIIIGIGIYEAWKTNRRVPLVVSGPHAIGRRAQTAAAIQ